MSIKLTKRIAADIMGRGLSSVRIKEGATAEAQKAITRADVRELVKNGSIYAIKEKENLSLHSQMLREKRMKGRRRGQGKRRGSIKARGAMPYKQKIRAQRRVLAELKGSKEIDNITFKKFYALVKGGIFPSKQSLLFRLKTEGVKLDDARMEKLRHV